MTDLIIDSDLTREEALSGKDMPPEILDSLELIEVDYRGFDDRRHRGQILVAKPLADEVRAIFADLLAANFPIETVQPVCLHNWSDDESMAANNSSGFNYRFKPNSTDLSLHARGLAIDINPLLNPYIKDSLILPPNGTYDPTRPGTIVPGDAVVHAFESRGWTWGGRWTHLKDYHHFEKTPAAR